MTPVQAATIPLFLSNKDVLVEAVTGSGKVDDHNNLYLTRDIFYIVAYFNGQVTHNDAQNRQPNPIRSLADTHPFGVFFHWGRPSIE